MKASIFGFRTILVYVMCISNWEKKLSVSRNVYFHIKI